MKYWLALQQRSTLINEGRHEHLWSAIPSPAELVPLRLWARGYGASTMIERVWSPVGTDGGINELVFCDHVLEAAAWDPVVRLRFAAPLQRLIQDAQMLREIRVRVVGPLRELTLICVDAAEARLALDMPGADALVAQRCSA